MVCLATLMTYKYSSPLAGVLGLSGTQALDIEALGGIKGNIVDSIRNTPLFLYHGHNDDVIRIQSAELSY